MGRPVSLPAPIADYLEQALGAGVREVQIFEHSLFARLHIRAVATTRRGRIYLRGSAAEFFENAWLMLHEYCHVLRQWEPGLLTTCGYLAECLRRGYWNNRFEVEAREFADTHLAGLVAALKQARASAEQRLAPVESAGDEHQPCAQRQGRAD